MAVSAAPSAATSSKRLNDCTRRLRSSALSFGVIIEITGLVDPAPDAHHARTPNTSCPLRVQEICTLPKRYKLDGICTIADAKHGTQHLDEEEPEQNSPTLMASKSTMTASAPARPYSSGRSTTASWSSILRA